MARREVKVEDKSKLACELPVWKCRKCWFVFLGVAIFLIGSLMVLFNNGQGISTAVQDYELIILAGFTVIAGIFCYRAINKDFPIERKFVLFLTIAMAFRLIGESIWAYHELVLYHVPTLSFADFSWYLSYFMLFFAFGYKIKKTFIEDKSKRIYAALAIAFLISALLIYFNVPFNLTGDDFLLPLALELYISFDLFVLALIFVLGLSALDGYNRATKPFFLLFFGFISFAIFDFVYAGLVLSNKYTGGEEINILYSLAYVFVLMGIMLKYRFIDCQND